MADSHERIMDDGPQAPTALRGYLRPFPGLPDSRDRTGDAVDRTGDVVDRTGDAVPGPEAHDRRAVEAFFSKHGFTLAVASAASEWLNDALHANRIVTIWHSASRKVLSGLLTRRASSPTHFRLIVSDSGSGPKFVDIVFMDFVYTRFGKVPADTLAELMPAASAEADIAESGPSFPDATAFARSETAGMAAAATALARKDRLGDGTDITMGRFLLHLDARTKDDAEACIARFLTIERADIDTLLTELERKDRDVAALVRTIVEGDDVQAAAERFYKAKDFPDAAKNDKALFGYVNRIIALLPDNKRFPVLARFPDESEGAEAAFKVLGVARFTDRDSDLRGLHDNIKEISGRIHGGQNQILVDALVYQYGGLTIEELEMLPFGSLDVAMRINKANLQLARFGYVVHFRNGVAVLGKRDEDLMLSSTIEDARQYTTRFDRYVATDSTQAREKAQAEDARQVARHDELARRHGAPIRRANERARNAAIRAYLSATNNKNKYFDDLKARVGNFILATREEIDGVVELLSNAGNRRATAAAVLITSLRTATADDARTCAMNEYASAARVAEHNRNPEYILRSVNDAIKNALAARDGISVRAAGKKTIMATHMMPDIAFAHGGFRVITGAIDNIKLLHDRAIEAAGKLKTLASRNPYNNGRLLTLALAYQYHGVPLSDLDQLPFIFRDTGDPDLNTVIEKANIGLMQSGLWIHVRNGIAVLGQYTGSEGNLETVPLAANRRKSYPESPLKKAYL